MAMEAQGSLVLFLVLLAVLMRPITRLLDLTVERKDCLNLTPEELSLSLPSRNRHVRWIDVYAVSVNPRGKRFSRKWPYVSKVELPASGWNSTMAWWLGCTCVQPSANRWPI